MVLGQTGFAFRGEYGPICQSMTGLKPWHVSYGGSADFPIFVEDYDLSY